MKPPSTKYVLGLPLDTAGQAALLSIPKAIPVQYEFGNMSLTHQQLVKNLQLRLPAPTLHYLRRPVHQ